MFSCKLCRLFPQFIAFNCFFISSKTRCIAQHVYRIFVVCKHVHTKVWLLLRPFHGLKSRGIPGCRVRPIPGIHTDTDTRYRSIGMSKHIGIGMDMIQQDHIGKGIGMIHSDHIGIGMVVSVEPYCPHKLTPNI